MVRYLGSVAAGALGATFAVLLCVAGPVEAQTPADVAGTWALEVTTDNGVTHPTVVLEQDGTELQGSYSSEALGRATVTGSVDGNRVTFSFSGSIQGQAIPVRYTGTVGDDGRLTGTIDIADGMLTGTFVATRSAR